MTPLVWIGIAVCISQSAMFSGLNLAVFSVSRLRLEVEAKGGNKDALRVLALRRRSNLLLTTILWGNVGVNVLLAQLANSVLAGVLAFREHLPAGPIVCTLTGHGLKDPGTALLDVSEPDPIPATMGALVAHLGW